MSATPRPWKARYDGAVEAWGLDGVDGHEIIEAHRCPDHPNRSMHDVWLIERAVNAFDALLAVAKAAQHEGCCDRVSCGNTRARLEAMDALDAAFPNWRTWTP